MQIVIVIGFWNDMLCSSLAVRARRIWKVSASGCYKLHGTDPVMTDILGELRSYEY